jgi:hypothetical protein
MRRLRLDELIGLPNLQGWQPLYFLLPPFPASAHEDLVLNGYFFVGQMLLCW